GGVDVRSGSGDEDLCGRPSGGRAQGFRGTVRVSARSTRPGPTEGTSVLVHQSHVHAPQSVRVGWKRTVGMCETSGARSIPLAGSERCSERVDAARRTGDVDLRYGPGASAPTVELVSQ